MSSTEQLFERDGIVAVSQCAVSNGSPGEPMETWAPPEFFDWWSQILAAAIGHALRLGTDGLIQHWTPCDAEAASCSRQLGDRVVGCPMTLRVQSTIVAPDTRVVTAIAFPTGHEVAKSAARSARRAAKKFFKEMKASNA